MLMHDNLPGIHQEVAGGGELAVVETVVDAVLVTVLRIAFVARSVAVAVGLIGV